MATDDRSSDNRLSNQILYIGIIAFLVGLFLGLVVLGWWLWPVQWTDSYPQYLAPTVQEDYARMAVDSYSVNGDVALAQQRYNSLGPAGPTAMAAVEQSPGQQDPVQIAAYGEAVAPVSAAAGTPTPTSTPIPAAAATTRGGTAEPAAPSWLRLLLALCLVAIVVAALVYWLFWRSRRRHEVATAPVEGPPPAVAVGEPEVEETPPVWAPARQYAMEELPTTEAPPAAAVEEVAIAPPEAEPAPDLGIAPLAAVAAAAAVAAPEAEPAPDLGIVPPAAVAAAAVASTEEPVAPEPTDVEEQAYKPAKMTYKLQYVEGIGDVYAERLRVAGVTSPETLLEKGATRKGRDELAEVTGISEKLLLRWVNQVDLYRIKGIGEEYADLLEVGGVDTVIELAQRNPINLHLRLTEINEQKHLVRQPPSLAQVQDWVLQAKRLPRIITY